MIFPRGGNCGTPSAYKRLMIRLPGVRRCAATPGCWMQPLRGSSGRTIVVEMESGNFVSWQIMIREISHSHGFAGTAGTRRGHAAADFGGEQFVEDFRWWQFQKDVSVFDFHREGSDVVIFALQRFAGFQ